MSQSAIAGDGVNLRLKVNSDLFQVQNIQAVDEDGEDIKTANGKTTTMGLFQGTPRFEATYVITPNIEAGLILGFANASSEADGEWDSTETTRRVGLTGSYNFKLADGLRGYAQPMLISGKTTSKDEDGESLGGISSLTYGLNLGLRVKLVKGATFDPGFEYLMGSGNQFDDKGEAVEEVTANYSSFGLKAGISVKF